MLALYMSSNKDKAYLTLQSFCFEFILVKIMFKKKYKNFTNFETKLNFRYYLQNKTKSNAT